MPNWCENELSVTGSGVSEFHAFTGDTLDFEKFVPIPEEEKNNWYEWCIANWGTKWNANNTAFVATPRKLLYAFDTAWAPPEPVIYAMSKKFDTLTFTHAYFEGGMGFSGRMKWKGGEVLLNVYNDNYKGGRGG